MILESTSSAFGTNAMDELVATIPPLNELEKELLANHIKKDIDKDVSKTLIEEIYKRGVQDGYIYGKKES
jgi:galactokinase/mevalonate kinase-like predicted kinase